VVKNVLMICYYYPPLNDVGCKRSIAFAKYFKKHGWNPIILTVKNPDKAYCCFGKNEDFPVGIPVERSYSLVNPYKFLGKINGILARILKIFGIRLSHNYLYDLFCIPDIFSGWIPLSLVKAWSIVKRRDVDTVYVSCSPFSSAVIGVLLKFFTNKYLVTDFRDPFAIRKVSFLGVPSWRMKINQKLERQILTNSDIFIVTTEETRKAYIEEYPGIENKIFTIYNGFDSQNFVPAKLPKFQKFTIIYAGEFYFYNAYSHHPFFEAIHLLKETGKINKDSFQFLFYGEDKNTIQEIAKEYEINDLIHANSRIPYAEINYVISKSHLHFIRIISELTISVKLLDGIPLNTPFLATIPDCEAAQIIEKFSPSSYIISDNSSQKIADAILNAMEKYNRGEILDNRINAFLEDFSREELTLRLMDIMKKNFIFKSYQDKKH
jgi:glycosyltransferase involved in cell wall biosynthesis